MKKMGAKALGAGLVELEEGGNEAAQLLPLFGSKMEPGVVQSGARDGEPAEGVALLHLCPPGGPLAGSATEQASLVYTREAIVLWLCLQKEAEGKEHLSAYSIHPMHNSVRLRAQS